MNRRNLLKSVIGATAVMAFSPKKWLYAAPADKTQWTILGSRGGPRVSYSGRANPANVLQIGSASYVIDCGYGVVKGLSRANVSLSSIRAIFMTHLHSDHTLDYGDIAYIGWMSGISQKIAAYAPVGLRNMTENYWKANIADIKIRMVDEGRYDPRRILVPHEITKNGQCYQDENVTVTAFQTPHPPIMDNYAFRFETAAGSIVYVADASFNPALADFAKNADILIHEALYLPRAEAMAKQARNADTFLKHILDSHTVTEDVGKLAQMAHVKKLVLSHLVPADDPSITDDMWKAAAAKNYKGEIIVAHDNMRLNL